MRHFRPFCQAAFAALIILVAGGCGSKYKQPSIEDVDVVQPNLGTEPNTVDADIANARDRKDALDAEIAREADSVAAAAMRECTAYTCGALQRRELALGMTLAQVLAATTSTRAAWSFRGDAGAHVMLPRNQAVHDHTGQVALVAFRNGTAVSYAYRDPTGVRFVTAPADATTAGRRRTMAQRLIRDGDDLVAAGRLYEALDKYVEADILDPDDPATASRIDRLLSRLGPPADPDTP
jgi:hypothetical protein